MLDPKNQPSICSSPKNKIKAIIFEKWYLAIKLVLLKLEWSNQTVDFGLEFVKQLLVVGMFADQQRNGSPFNAHRSAQVHSAGRIRVWDTLVLADARQMAHDFNGRHISGKDDDSVNSNIL